MRETFPVAHRREPVRDVGLAMANDNLDLVPIVDDDGVLAGVMTIRALARRYIRESREASSLGDAATTVEAVVRVLEGEMVAGEDQELDGRIWVSTMAIGSSPAPIGAGDVMVVGDREDAQRRALELGVSLLVIPNSSVPSKAILALAEGLGTTVVISPLDAYVTARMITLAAPCEALMESEPLTVSPDDLVSEISDQIKDVHYGAAVAVDDGNRPLGLVARSDLVAPMRRRIMLVDHAELAQSVPGADEADILEILDHHHIGSIETHVPVTATFDPVGLDRHPGDRALPPERARARPPDGDPAARRDPLRHGDPQLAHHHRARPRGGGLPGEGAGPRRDGVRPRDVRGHLRRLAAPGGEGGDPRRQGVRASGRPDDVHRPDRDGGQGPARAPGRADRRRWRKRAPPAATCCSR